MGAEVVLREPSRCDAIAWFITPSSSSPYSEHAMPVIESVSKIVTGIGETVGAGIGTNVGVEIGTLVGGYVVGMSRRSRSRSRRRRKS